MPVTSPSPIDLDAEDFRRLGVRPFECRLAVIRSAAARSARALAQQQLNSPSAQVGLQLSRVATSAYRLLDPRQRHDSNQRVHVGRILPTVLTFSEQTNFRNGAVQTQVEAPFHQGSAGNAESIEPLELQTWSALDLTTDPKENDSHRHAWLDSTFIRGVRIRTRWQHPWAMLTGAGLIVGTILGLATMRSRGTESTLRPSDATAVSEPLPSQSSSGEQRIPDEPVEPQPASPEPATSVQPMTVSGITESDVLPSLAAPKLAAPSLANSASLLPSERDVQIEPPVRETTSGGSGSDGFLSDPFALLATTDRPPEPPAADLVEPVRAEPDLSPSAEPDERAIYSVPEDAGIRAARAHLVSLVPELAHSVTPKDVATRIAAIEDLEEGLSIGSADYWTARLVVAELAWLVEDASQVSRRLNALTEYYHVPIGQPLSDSFIAACDAATLPETHQHLLSHGLRLADQLLISKSFEQCRHVIEAVKPSAEILESESARRFLEQLSQAADQMDRLAASASRMVDDAGEIDVNKADGKILGRYYCLMLRQWDLGLLWLVEASDARIASVARREFELGDTASADDLISLSQRWMAAAARSSGRASDSMRLHAVDLMQRALPETSGLKKLELESKTDEALELVPAFLRKLTPTLTAVKPDSPALPKSKPGLSGRIKIDGQDIGVQLDYELGVAFTQSVLDTIGQHLDRASAPMSIQLIGQFQLDEAATVLVSIARPGDLTQEVQVDGTPLEFDPLEDAANVSLRPGTHQIDWVIEVERLTTRAFLSVHGGPSNRPLGVVQPTRSPSLPTKLTVAMVRSGQ